MTNTGQFQTETAAEHKKPARTNIFEVIYNWPAAMITPIFLPFSVTPNQITIISGLFGIAGAALLVLKSHLMLVLAAVFIQLFAILDLVDGNIARAKNMQSSFGAWLDIFFDKLNDFLLIACLTIGAYRDISRPHVLILGMCLMGFVFFSQFSMEVNNMRFNPIDNARIRNFGQTQSQHRNLKRLMPLIGLFRNIFKHTILGHSCFLFLISVFACFNIRYYGLCFLVLHAIVTLVLIITSIFCRLW